MTLENERERSPPKSVRAHFKPLSSNHLPVVKNNDNHIEISVASNRHELEQIINEIDELN